MDRSVHQCAHRGPGDLAADYRLRISAALFLGLLVVNVAGGQLPRQIRDLSSPLGAAAVLLVLAGLGLRSWAAGTLCKGRALTTWGPYRLCRHPLYLGSLMVMAGFCLLVPAPTNAVVVLGPFGVMYWLTMLREERRLAQKYGPAWQAYAAATPRLLPTRFPGTVRGPWSLAQWSRSREHRAAVATLLLVAVFEIWHVCMAVVTGR